MPLSENPCEENLWLGNYFLQNLCTFLNIETPPPSENATAEEKETFYNKLKRQLLLQQGKLISLIAAKEKTHYLEEIEELLSHEKLFQSSDLANLNALFNKRKQEFERLDGFTADILHFPMPIMEAAQSVQGTVEEICATPDDFPPLEKRTKVAEALKIYPDELVLIVEHYDIDHTDFPVSQSLQDAIRKKVREEFLAIDPKTDIPKKTQTKKIDKFVKAYGGEALFRLKAVIFEGKNADLFRKATLDYLVDTTLRFSLQLRGK